MQAATTGENALIKKLSHRRVGRSPLPEIDLVAESFGRLLEEKLRPVLKTICTALILDCRIVKLSSVLEGIPTPAMLGLVEVESAENFALISMNPDLVNHTVDLRMGGDPAHAPGPMERNYTAIDNALCTAFLDALLSAFHGSLVATMEGHEIPKLSLADQKQNITLLRIAPDNADVLLLNISLEIGEGGRTGEFDFIIPLSVLDVFRATATEHNQPSTDFNPNDLWKTRMKQAGAEASVPLDAVLFRTRMTLEQIESLKPGDVITMPGKMKNEVRLIMSYGNEDESQVAMGVLGIYEENKVIKLQQGPDPVLQSHLSELIFIPGH